mgnify:CR=1 FL=1
MNGIIKSASYSFARDSRRFIFYDQYSRNDSTFVDIVFKEIANQIKDSIDDIEITIHDTLKSGDFDVNGFVGFDSNNKLNSVKFYIQIIDEVLTK